jgi:methionyl-tRNA formyltransferase
LPRWRGAAPIQRAIEAGDSETGVALQKMVRELDAGDVLGVRKVQLTDEWDAISLHDRLAQLGTELVTVELMDFIRGNLAAQPQNPQLVTYARKLDKSEADLDWNTPARSLFNKIRAFKLGPGSVTSFQGQRVKIHEARVASDASLKYKGQTTPGAIVEIVADRIVVATAEGFLELYEVQPESRNRMKVAEFLKGRAVKVGDHFEFVPSQAKSSSTGSSTRATIAGGSPASSSKPPVR